MAPPTEAARRVLAIMRQAETVEDLHEFATAQQTRAIVGRLVADECEQLAEEYDLLRLRLRGRIKFDALAGRRVIVTSAGRPYYSDKQGADVVEFAGVLVDDGRPFRTTSAAPNVVRYFRRLELVPSTERPLNLRLQRVNHSANPNLWKVRAIGGACSDPSDVNPFRGEEA